MATKKVTGKKINMKKKKPTDALKEVKDKFAYLKKLRKKIADLKSLYVEHNQLMEELLPLFIETTPDQFIVKREITVGSTKYRFTPFFYDEKKGIVVPKVWKSTAFESGAIE